MNVVLEYYLLFIIFVFFILYVYNNKMASASGVLDALSSMDLSSMFASPFLAANEAQTAISSSTIEFIQKFAFDQDASGNNKGSLKTFTLNTFTDTPPDSSGNTYQTKKQLTLPIITLLNVPSLAIQRVQLDFTLKIDAQTSESNQSVSERAQKSSSGSRFGSLVSKKTTTQVSSTSSHQDSKDSKTSAKLVVQMVADNRPPAGMQMIIDFCNRTDTAPERSGNTAVNAGNPAPAAAPL